MATFQFEIPIYSVWDANHLLVCRLVVEDEDGICGWVALSPVSSRCVYAGVCEVSVYVSKVARAKGVGTLLLDTVIAESEKQGIGTLQSGIMQNNNASIHLHEKCGFRMVGYRERIGKDHNGIWRNTVLMERRSGNDVQVESRD